ncbi:serine/threonine protein kinase [Pseudoxanthomonas broegbernensis]|uniref:Serine/threonine protein kinase n=1 Tax=Pseudoxanthomonas broegbernensis TaxID=83619 RepID=A0A7V8GLU7_9GAMM|nr:serine/threonine-protein kinase [Pseudoxanthomonas broegbernensis]KAF1686090.1 serine/threonine protein kinase [Pseudoxanthomonas broegbernensis]MBB6063781.1 serine/threonine-protein kinase [Pseudoxanthomonas broegbernensis]
MEEGSGRYQRVKRIVLEALELQGRAREALIERETGGDPGLAQEVRALLAEMEADPTLAVSLRPAPGNDDPGSDLSGQETSAQTPREYRLLRRLGAGGMGVVYLAERSDGGFVQKVALKLLNAVAEASPELRERFARERELLARLDHPGIARLLDGGILADGRPFLAMEYVEGERIDLHAERLPLNERIALFAKVCEAVADAHRCLVIHRDLKPANILVDARGQPRLLDFGIARLIEDEDVAAQTQTGQHALTLAYASPEQVACQPLTTATDVYSLGAVLYQLVCGSAPFADVDTPAGLYHAIVRTDVTPPSRRVRRGEPPPPRGRGRAVPADIDAIVLKALRKEPEQRYASVAALADDLHRYLRRRPVAARGGERWYRLRRFLRRNAWSIAGAAVVALSVLAGLVASLYALREARVQQAVAETRGRDLQRIVDFQQSMLEGVDIDAMGHALTDTQQRQVLAALAGQPPGTALEERLEQAFAQVGAPSIARDALDEHVVSYALSRLDQDFSDAPLLAADMRQSLARVLMAIGHYPHAAEELRRVLEARLVALPATDARRLSARVDLGQALHLQAQDEEAGRVLARALDDAARLPPLDPLRRAAEAGAARVTAARGGLQAALARQGELRDAWMAALPENDLELLALRRDYADTLVKLGRRDDAQTEMEHLLPLYVARFGEDSNKTLAVKQVLAEHAFTRHDFEKSAELARAVAEARERRLGAEHPDTLSAWGTAATSLVRLAVTPEDFVQVHALLDRLLRVQGRILGMDHPATRQFVVDRIRLLSKEERQEEALALQREHYARCLHALGAEHPDTLFARGSLASLLSYAGRYDEARAHAQATLDAQRRVMGIEHPIGTATLDLIGRIERGAGNWEASRDAHAQALEIRARTRGMLDAHTIESASRLYVSLYHLHDEAGMADIRARFLDPVIALDPGTINASMRSVRDASLRALEGRWE